MILSESTAARPSASARGVADTKNPLYDTGISSATDSDDNNGNDGTPTHGDTTESQPVVQPTLALSRTKAIALVATVTGASFLNASHVPLLPFCLFSPSSHQTISPHASCFALGIVWLPNIESTVFSPEFASAR